MDLNTILCVGRSDMYGTASSVPQQQFYPLVSSFQMDSLRASVRKDKPDSRSSSSRHSSGSPGSPSKSILRAPVGSPKQASPNGNRNVRFTDNDSRRDLSGEFARIHVNSTTQTNGNGSHTMGDTAVQVYSSSAFDIKDKKSSSRSSFGPNYRTAPSNGYNSPPASMSPQRRPVDRSPTRYTGSPIRYPGYSNSPENVVKQQRELPRTPIQRVGESAPRQQGYNMSQQTVGTNAERKYAPTSSGSPSNQRRVTLATQTPSAPTGQRIIQNMNFDTHDRPVTPENVRTRNLGGMDGNRIIQNMSFEKYPTEKSIGIQAYVETKIQPEPEPEPALVKDAEVQTPRDVGVQTPRDGEEENDKDDTNGDTSTVSHACSQTVSDDDDDTSDDEQTKDASIQTPRDVGVQTPRSVSIQTSDGSSSSSEEEEEESATSVAVQTPTAPDGHRITQNMDIHTTIWSNTPRTGSVTFSRREEDSKRQTSSSARSSTLPRPNFDDLLSDESDDEVDLPSHLTEPFPQKTQVYAYDKLKASSVGSSKGRSAYEPKPGTLIAHSAKQLLEMETNPKPQSNIRSSLRNGKSDFKRKDTRSTVSPAANRQSTSTTNRAKEEHQTNQTFQNAQQSQCTHDAGTQFHSTYHLDLQAEEDRINELATALDFTPIETHSFDPGTKAATPSSLVPTTVPRLSLEQDDSQLRNSFIKDVDLGPAPRQMETLHDRRLVDYSSPRQRVVKSVDFGRSRRDRYRDNVGPNYIFFKNTGHGSRYESFDPQPRHSARRPHSSYSSPTRSSLAKSRPTSAPSTPRGSAYTGYLTPALYHMKKQAIRRYQADTSNPWPYLISKPRPTDNFQRSDTFLSSTQPPARPLTVPIDNAAPSHFPGTRLSRDDGSFESLGNQPRAMTDLTSSTNCRPKPKRKSRTPSPLYRQREKDSSMSMDKRYKSYSNDRNGSTMVSDSRSQSGFSTSSKPPIPRGKSPKKDRKRSPVATESEKRVSTRAGRDQTGADAQSQRRPSPRQGSRDQGTTTTNQENHLQSDINCNRGSGTSASVGNSDTDSAFIGNQAILEIIEKANL